MPQDLQKTDSKHSTIQFTLEFTSTIFQSSAPLLNPISITAVLSSKAKSTSSFFKLNQLQTHMNSLWNYFLKVTRFVRYDLEGIGHLCSLMCVLWRSLWSKGGHHAIRAQVYFHPRTSSSNLNLHFHMFRILCRGCWSYNSMHFLQGRFNCPSFLLWRSELWNFSGEYVDMLILSLHLFYN